MVNKLNASRIKLDGIYTDTRGIHAKERYNIPTPEKDVEIIEVRGRENVLTKEYGYLPIPLTMNFYMKKEQFKPAFRKAKPFILNAKTLQVDDDIDVYYKIKKVKINEAENQLKTFGEFEVEMTLDPFQYEIKNEPITITSRTNVRNEGYTSEPVFNVHVKGTGNLYIGQQKVIIKDVNGNITVDSQQMNAYRREGGLITSLNKHMIGKFPVLNTGSNWIHFDGDISKVEVIPNRMWV